MSGISNTLPFSARSYIVIPARLESTRLPKKMLLRETGKSLLQHTYESACRARKPLGVCVATDHPDIAAEVCAFGGRVIMTSSDCASGTDRVAEAAKKLGGADVIVNVQGDEPEIDPDAIDNVIGLLERNRNVQMSTLATPIRSEELLDDPACVKVVFNEQGHAIYFSRNVIPSIANTGKSVAELLDHEPPIWHQHVGIYAYRRTYLMELAKLPQTALEKSERLEQLRVLEHGDVIAVASIEQAALGIDTADDYQGFVHRKMAA